MIAKLLADCQIVLLGWSMGNIMIKPGEQILNKVCKLLAWRSLRACISGDSHFQQFWACAVVRNPWKGDVNTGNTRCFQRASIIPAYKSCGVPPGATKRTVCTYEPMDLWVCCWPYPQDSPTLLQMSSPDFYSEPVFSLTSLCYAIAVSQITIVFDPVYAMFLYE